MWLPALILACWAKNDALTQGAESRGCSLGPVLKLVYGNLGFMEAENRVKYGRTSWFSLLNRLGWRGDTSILPGRGNLTTMFLSIVIEKNA